MATIRDPYVCSGLALARQTVMVTGGLSDTAIAAQLRIGPSFARPIPADVTGAMEVAASLINLALEHDPRLLDDPPIVETAFGRLPLYHRERCTKMEQLARIGPHADGGTAKQLLRASAALEARLRSIEELYLLRRKVIWQAMRDTEWAACDLLARYLTANLETARKERARYLHPGSALPYATSPDVLGLQAAVRRIAAARGDVQLDTIKREQTVVECIAFALTVDAIARSVNRLDFGLDDQTWKDIAHASALANQARLHTSQAMVRFLTVLRKEAAVYPVVLVLDHVALRWDRTVLPLGRAVDEALRKAEQAIGDLMASGVNVETFHAFHTVDDLTFTGMAERIANSAKVSVWKLPFFIERALLNAPADHANVSRRMLHFAAEVESGDDIKNGLKLFGMDTAMMVAPATGFVGVALAFAWAIFTLGKTIHEYGQLSDLFAASIDPSAILLGEEHGPASQLGIFLDLLGLIVV